MVSLPTFDASPLRKVGRMTYSLHRIESMFSEGKSKSVDIAGTVSRIADAATQILAEEHAQPLGILLSHKYSKSEHDRGHLKGAASYLVAALRQANVSCVCGSCLMRLC